MGIRRADPDTVDSLAEFAAALATLRAGRSYADLGRAARALPPRNGRRPALPSSTVSDLLAGRSAPTRETLLTFLTVCGVPSDEHLAWLGAWERMGTTRPRGAARVGEVPLRWLGVHPAIQVRPGGWELPAYVPRDVDDDLRSALLSAAAEGGLVLLLGGPSVGKTRTLAQAVADTLPGWWLARPTDAGGLAAVAAGPVRHCVVWLDEFHVLLDDGAAAAADTLVGYGAVLAATMGHREYRSRRIQPPAHEVDVYAADRRLLRLARVVDLPAAFSAAERERAGDLAATDPRLRLALDAADAGVVQVLAAGPELVRWWEHAPAEECYGRALLTAAVDAHRIGARAPLSRALLLDAAPHYLTPAERAAAPDDWADRAVAYATTPLLGAVPALHAVADRIGTEPRYLAADYLCQHARTVRRTIPVPDGLWRALFDHHREDAFRIGEAAKLRGVTGLAEAFYTRAREDGDERAVRRLKQLAEQKRRTQLSSRVVLRRPVPPEIVDELIEVHRRRAEKGDPWSLRRAAELIVEYDRLDTVRAEVAGGDEAAGRWLLRVLLHLDRLDEAVALARDRPGIPDTPFLYRLVHGLLERGRIDEAADLVRARFELAMFDVPAPLQWHLTRPGHADRMREWVAAGDPLGLHVLVTGYLRDGERERALAVLRDNADDAWAASRLASLLDLDHNEDELRERADDGDWYAAHRLVDLLILSGRRHALAAEQAAGTPGAADRGW